MYIQRTNEGKKEDRNKKEVSGVRWSLPQSQTDKVDSMKIHGMTPHISMGQIQIRSWAPIISALTISHHLEIGDPSLISS